MVGLSLSAIYNPISVNKIYTCLAKAVTFDLNPIVIFNLIFPCNRKMFWHWQTLRDNDVIDNADYIRVLQNFIPPNYSNEDDLDTWC